MKVKLLRKIRKRFEINYYPNGYEFGKYTCNIACVAIVDKYFGTLESPIVNYYYVEMTVTKEQAYEKCYDLLLRHLLSKYERFGTRRKKKLTKTVEKLWYPIK